MLPYLQRLQTLRKHFQDTYLPWIILTTIPPAYKSIILSLAFFTLIWTFLVCLLSFDFDSGFTDKKQTKKEQVNFDLFLFVSFQTIRWFIPIH
ncbi:hypothetical protein HMPREF9372_2138 [Sporosarcina newyorkensis 2681]|uniref:Uncharacterized protein n=1 Tax=Sporosarcina newyorkensis 2681 TaxID=1027292 RepID=F9DTK7_9BACL|nr:hypothetical protein HMPREF9372_2138 [Sporosarcina newyorkensis 2681]